MDFLPLSLRCATGMNLNIEMSSFTLCQSRLSWNKKMETRIPRSLDSLLPACAWISHHESYAGSLHLQLPSAVAPSFSHLCSLHRFLLLATHEEAISSNGSSTTRTGLQKVLLFIYICKAECPLSICMCVCLSLCLTVSKLIEPTKWCVPMYVCPSVYNAAKPIEGVKFYYYLRKGTDKPVKMTLCTMCSYQNSTPVTESS